MSETCLCTTGKITPLAKVYQRYQEGDLIYLLKSEDGTLSPHTQCRRKVSNGEKICPIHAKQSSPMKFSELQEKGEKLHDSHPYLLNCIKKFEKKNGSTQKKKVDQSMSLNNGDSNLTSASFTLEFNDDEQKLYELIFPQIEEIKNKVKLMSISSPDEPDYDITVKLTVPSSSMIFSEQDNMLDEEDNEPSEDDTNVKSIVEELIKKSDEIDEAEMNSSSSDSESDDDDSDDEDCISAIEITTKPSYGERTLALDEKSKIVYDPESSDEIGTLTVVNDKKAPIEYEENDCAVCTCSHLFHCVLTEKLYDINTKNIIGKLLSLKKINESDNKSKHNDKIEYDDFIEIKTSYSKNKIGSFILYLDEKDNSIYDPKSSKVIGTLTIVNDNDAPIKYKDNYCIVSSDIHICHCILTDRLYNVKTKNLIGKFSKKKKKK